MEAGVQIRTRLALDSAVTNKLHALHVAATFQMADRLDYRLRADSENSYRPHALSTSGRAGIYPAPIPQ
jgi:hypothetical protein